MLHTRLEERSSLLQMRAAARDAQRQPPQPVEQPDVLAVQEEPRMPAPSAPAVDDGACTTACVASHRRASGKFSALIDRVQQQLDVLERDLSSSREFDPWAVIRQRLQDAGAGGPPKGPGAPPPGDGRGDEQPSDDDHDGTLPPPGPSAGPAFARTLGAARSLRSPRTPTPSSPVRRIDYALTF